jgi:hypothetical protein
MLYELATQADGWCPRQRIDQHGVAASGMLPTLATGSECVAGTLIANA